MPTTRRLTNSIRLGALSTATRALRLRTRHLGAWAAYRYLGDNTDLFSTFDVILAGQKGWEVGTNYTLFKNTVASVKYFNGENIDNGKDAEKLFGRVEFHF